VPVWAMVIVLFALSSASWCQKALPPLLEWLKYPDKHRKRRSIAQAGDDEDHIESPHA
jgi:hypothetical protein